MTTLFNTYRTAYARCKQYGNPPIWEAVAGALAVCAAVGIGMMI